MNAPVDFGFIYFADFKTERHVVVHGHVRIQSVVLKNHRNVPVFRRHVVHQFAVDVQLAFGNVFQSGNHS